MILILTFFILGILFKKFFPQVSSLPKVLNELIIYVCLPAVILLKAPSIPLNLNGLYPILMPWVQFGMSFILFSLLDLWFQWPHQTKIALILLAGLGNTSFIGFPLIEYFYGKAGLPTGILVDQGGSFFVMSTVGIGLAAAASGGSTQLNAIIKRILFFPPFLSLIIALFFHGLYDNPSIHRLLEIPTKALAPMALFSVGSQLRLKALTGQKLPLTFGLTYKLILSPLILYFLYFNFLKQQGLQLDVIVFEAAMPPMITAGIIVSERKLNPDLASAMVGFGLIASIITLPLCWYLLKSI